MASDTVQKVKERLSIVDVVSPYVKLTKAGKYYKGLSPFNKEKTPSFYVNPDRQSYFCFSSGQGGDMFTFIEKMEGLDFKGALKVLAEKAGVEIVYERGSKDSGKIDRLRDAVARAESFFTRSLVEEGGAYQYALKRGLTKENIAHWGLGYAPDAWRALLEELSGAGFSLQELQAAGLVKEADGKSGTWYDRFRNRLMFPIRDAAGRTVGFTGRALDPDNEAKYLNSPETELYKKSEVLFGMDRAKDAIRTRGFALLVEGQFDLLMLHQIGFQNTIALSGTALTPFHLSLIKRYADNLMLCLDADRAGLAASAKNAEAALAAGMRVKAVRLPEGKDPADLAVEDKKAFEDAVKNASWVVNFFMAHAGEVTSGFPEYAKRIITDVLPLIAAIRNPAEQVHYINQVASLIELTPIEIKRLLPARDADIVSEKPSAAQGFSVEKEVLQKDATGLREEQLIAIVLAYPETSLANRIISEYCRITSVPFPERQLSERTLFEAGLAYGESPDEHAADDLIRNFEISFIKGQLKETQRRLWLAESNKDKNSIDSVTREWDELSRRLADLH